MDIKELDKQIKSGALGNLYFFYGEEQFLLENKIKSIKKAESFVAWLNTATAKWPYTTQAQNGSRLKRHEPYPAACPRCVNIGGILLRRTRAKSSIYYMSYFKSKTKHLLG